MDIQQQKQALQTLADDILQRAKSKGATAAEVGLNHGEGLSTEVHMGEIDTLEYNRDQGLNMTVYFGQCKGSASTADLSAKAIDEVLEAACRIAKYTSADEYSGLAESELMAQQVDDLDLYHPWDISADQAIELTKACEAVALQKDERITNSDGASFSSYAGLAVYANSNGFNAATAKSHHSLSCSVIAETNGAMEREYDYDYSRLPERLQSAESIGLSAADKVLKRLGAEVISTREAPILYTANVARSLIGHFTGAISGGVLYRKASFLQDSLGQSVFPEFIHLHEQPYLQQAHGSMAYDREGVATRTQDFVTEGCVSSYILSSYSARKMGLKTTANAGGTHNLTLDSTGESFDELLKKMDTGFLVTELMGSSVSIATGDYSRGAAGFWVENGEIQFPVKEVTVAGNLKDMFKAIVAVGNDVDHRSATRSGSILLENMMIAGK